MRFENVYSSTAQKAQARAEDVIAGAKNSAEKAATWVEYGKKPVRKITTAALKLSAISHRTADRLLQQQAAAVEGEFEAFSDHLRDLADAESLRDIVRQQAGAVPRVTGRALANTRSTAMIFGDARGDLTEVLRDTVNDLRGAPVVKKAKNKASAVKKKAKTVKKKAKKAAKKAPAKSGRTRTPTGSKGA